MGSLQRYLYFPEQLDATQTGQESSKATQPSKGEKYPAVPPCPALPVAPGLVGDAVIRQQCPPAGYLPLCSGCRTLGGQPAPHIITPVIQTSPFLMSWFFSSGSRNTSTPQDKSLHDHSAQGCSCGGEGSLSPGAVVGTRATPRGPVAGPWGPGECWCRFLDSTVASCWAVRRHLRQRHGCQVSARGALTSPEHLQTRTLPG